MPVVQRTRWHSFRVALLLLIVLLLCSKLASAQQPPPSDARPQGPPAGQPGMGPQLENPRAGPEHRRLAFLIGAWEEKVSYPGQSDKDGTGRWFVRPALGLYLNFQYQGEGPQGNYRAFGILSYDRDAGNYRLLWFDDAGGIGDYRGNFVDENSLVLEHRGKVDGRDFRERITYTRVSPAQLRTKIEQAWESAEYQTYLDATATRTQMPQPGGPQRPFAPRDDAQRPQRPPAQ